jgi:hypothetical protein
VKAQALVVTGCGDAADGATLATDAIAGAAASPSASQAASGVPISGGRDPEASLRGATYTLG